MESLIERFLSVEHGSGAGFGYSSPVDCGSGCGNDDGGGFGCGNGYGSGRSDGEGYCGYDGEYYEGLGSGKGRGSENGEVKQVPLLFYNDGSYELCNSYGDGHGYGGGGLLSINRKRVYQINNIPTVIDTVYDNYATGSLIEKNVYLTPCYIAKGYGLFAHGEILHDARVELEMKYAVQAPINNRIKCFVKAFPDVDVKIKVKRLSKWYSILTGSHEMGFLEFYQSRGIDWKGEYSVREFIRFCRNAEGSEVIQELARGYGKRLKK